ncbi:MAG TPA: hypothetical protein H9662_03890 [Firmicutes bacterium]|nr:hypothetical protein [Bacillota bacterium]
MDEISPEFLLKWYPMRMENVQKIRMVLHTCGYSAIQEQRILDLIVTLLRPVLRQEKR